MHCKGGVHFEVHRISVYKRLADSGKEYEFGCWVRNVIVMKLGDRKMQQHTELAKKNERCLIGFYSNHVCFNFFPCREFQKHFVQMKNNENTMFIIFVFRNSI